jgi:hypothetical protein
MRTVAASVLFTALIVTGVAFAQPYHGYGDNGYSDDRAVGPSYQSRERSYENRGRDPRATEDREARDRAIREQQAEERAYEAGRQDQSRNQQQSPTGDIVNGLGQLLNRNNR